jgi:peptidoglycan/LPS O-acetylase OafA/YrhL
VKPAYLRNYDLMRGIAAIVVMLFHGSAEWRQVFPEGYLAVDLFFGLSGVVIAQSYGDKLLNSLSFARFAAIRLVRLYPLYLVGLAIGFSYYIARADQLAVTGALLAGLLYLPVPVDIGSRSSVLPLNGPAWSLFFELAVNFGFALFLARLTNKLLLAIVLSSALLVAAAAIYVGDLDFGWTPHSLIGGFPRVAFSFGVGVLLYRFRPAQRQRSSVSLLLAVLTLGALAMGMHRWDYDLPVVMILFPAMLWLGLAFQPAPRWDRLCRLCGELSYPVYALHWPLIRYAGELSQGMTGVRLRLFWAAFYLGVLALSWVLVRVYDKPVRAYLERRMGLRAVHTAAGAEQRAAAF